LNLNRFSLQLFFCSHYSLQLSNNFEGASVEICHKFIFVGELWLSVPKGASSLQWLGNEKAKIAESSGNS
jgi:hypothetical protein